MFSKEVATNVKYPFKHNRRCSYTVYLNKNKDIIIQDIIDQNSMEYVSFLNFVSFGKSKRSKKVNQDISDFLFLTALLEELPKESIDRAPG